MISARNGTFLETGDREEVANWSKMVSAYSRRTKQAQQKGTERMTKIRLRYIARATPNANVDCPLRISGGSSTPEATGLMAQPPGRPGSGYYDCVETKPDGSTARRPIALFFRAEL